MNNCSNCGHTLDVRVKDGVNEYRCPNCNSIFYEPFNVAVSMIVKYNNLYLLIKQYHQDRFILVAGYINKGESAEDTVRRELYEEVKLEAKNIKYNMSKFYPKSNTLMLNYVVEVKDFGVCANSEVDIYSWFTKDNAIKNIAPNSLAKEFFLNYIKGEDQDAS